MGEEDDRLPTGIRQEDRLGRSRSHQHLLPLLSRKTTFVLVSVELQARPLHVQPGKDLGGNGVNSGPFHHFEDDC